MMGFLFKIIFSILFLFEFSYAKLVDFDKLLQNNDKKISIFFHLNGCPYCKRMKAKNFHDKRILQYLKDNFIFFEFNIDNEGKVKYQGKELSYKDLAIKLKVFVYPDTIFLSSKGTILYNAAGYKNIDEYFSLLKYIHTNEFKSMDFEEFLNNESFENE